MNNIRWLLPQTSRFYLVALGWVLGAAACTTSSGSVPTVDGTSGNNAESRGPLFEVPAHWEVANHNNQSDVYQANLQNRDGGGRMLVGRLPLEGNVREIDAYLHKLHTSLVDRIRGKADVSPFAQDRLEWSNGIVGYQTKLRGSIGRQAIVIEGLTFSDEKYAYFSYGLFPEDDYEEERSGFRALTTSFRPLQGAERRKSEPLDVDSETLTERDSATGPGEDSARSPEDYRSPRTHLGVVSWGTSRKALRRQEGEPLRESDRALAYRCQFAGIESCLVVYVFTLDKLTHGAFIIKSERDPPQKYVSEYLKLTKRLSKRFGQPEQSSAIWNTPKYKDQGDKWGEALARGHVIFGTVWHIGPTKVVHALRNEEDDGIDHRIFLSNDALREKLQKRLKASRSR